MLILVRFVLLLASVALLLLVLLAPSIEVLSDAGPGCIYLLVLCSVGFGAAHDLATCSAVRRLETAPSSSSLTVSSDEMPHFPIAEYDDLAIVEILPLLKELYDDELEVVELHERSTRHRPAIMTAIGDIRSRLASVEGDMTFSEMTAMGAIAFDARMPPRPVVPRQESPVVGG